MEHAGFGKAAPKKSRLHIWIIVLAAICVIAIATSVFFYLRSTTSPATSASRERDALVREVGQLVLLPNEEASVLTVADKSKLKNVALTDRVENGDKMLLFAQSKRLVVYRPKSHKVIDMLTISDTAQIKQ